VLWNNSVFDLFVHGAGETWANDNLVHHNTVPDMGPHGYIFTQGIANCGTTTLHDNLVLQPIQQQDGSCPDVDNNATAPGANEMTSAVQVGCNFAGCATHPPPAISGTSVAASIVADPDSLRVAAGQPASFSALGAGTPPLTYQWQRDGIDIAGATAATYTLAAAAAQDDGAVFTLRVSNSLGSQTTAPATLHVE
jgi:hypothetical protein